MNPNSTDTSVLSLTTPPTRAILDALHHAVLLLDASGTILWLNSAALRLYGRSETECIGVPVNDCPVFNYTFRNEILRVLHSSGRWDGESERVRSDGTLVHVRGHWSRVDFDGGAAYVALEYDIADRINIEGELQQSRKLAKIGILADGIAHELRNPLSYALSAAQLLSDDRLPDDVREKCLHTITTGLRKAGLIVDNLLSLGKPAGRFIRKSVDLSGVVTEAIDAASTHSNMRHVRIDVHFPAEPLMVTGNHDMLVQVFHNVITNALNEMPGGGSISIQGTVVEGQVTVRVTDSGPGVSEEQLKHLFDPFFSASRSGKGTGLGLTLSYFIMKEHDGNIEVESVLGKGATFVLTIPQRHDKNA
jgi:PAS domain S-box-containing protein